MGCIAKCLLILINSIFMVVSLAFMAVGAILVFLPGKLLDHVYDSVKDSIPSNTAYTIPDSADDMGDVPFFKTVGTAMLVFGAGLFVISFLAYMGACCTTCCRCLLILYAIIVIVFIIVELFVGIMFFVANSPLHDETQDRLKGLIEDDYHDNSTDAFSLSLNLIHQHFDCCGIDGVADFGNKEHRSCDAQYEQVGCYSKLQDVIDDNIVWCSIGLAALCLLQIIEVGFAISLYKDNKIGPI